MDAFTAVVRRLLSACPPPAQCKCERAVKILRLCFYPSFPHLVSIGRAVEDTVSRGDTDRLEFEFTGQIPNSSDLIADRQAEWGQQFMSLFHACPIAFQWLTSLSLKSLELGDFVLPSLLGACDKLKHLSLRSCTLDEHSVLKIDMPNSVIHTLEFIHFRCKRIDLISVPKLTRLVCYSWELDNPPLHFGYVPDLLMVNLASCAKASQAPFALSECFSTNTRSLSRLSLSFSLQMVSQFLPTTTTSYASTYDFSTKSSFVPLFFLLQIWIKPEHPKQLTPMFTKLTDLVLWSIFPECDLNWTLFILEAAPALQKFTLNRTRHSCVKTPEDSAEKVNVVWEPSKDLKHQNLKLLVMMGFEEEDKVANYIRLVMERSAALKTIKLHCITCEACDAIGPEGSRRSEVDKASRRRVKERLTHGSSVSVKIIISDG
ncbi:unnamed protein product [Alopecurus aequalis]